MAFSLAVLGWVGAPEDSAHARPLSAVLLAVVGVVGLLGTIVGIVLGLFVMAEN